MRTTIADSIAELTTQRLTARIRDENGVGFKPDTLTLLLYDVATSGVINSRNRVSIRDANGGTLSATGLLTLQLDPADTVIVGTNNSAAGAKERHIALLEWTWGGGAKAGNHEIEMTVVNLAKVP